jgi:hypothetical protein
VMTPCIGKDFVFWEPPTREDKALGIVDFSIFPHLDHPDLPENTMTAAEQWAATLPNPAYAIDDDTAIRVVGGAVDLVTDDSGGSSRSNRGRRHELRRARYITLGRRSGDAPRDRPGGVCRCLSLRSRKTPDRSAPSAPTGRRSGLPPRRPAKAAS